MGHNFFPMQDFSPCGKILIDKTSGLCLPINSLYPEWGRRMAYLSVLDKVLVAHLYPSSFWEEMGHRRYLFPNSIIFIGTEIRHGSFLVQLGESNEGRSLANSNV